MNKRKVILLKKVEKTLKKLPKLEPVSKLVLMFTFSKQPLNLDNL